MGTCRKTCAGASKTLRLFSLMLGAMLVLGFALAAMPREARADGTIYDPASTYTGFQSLANSDTATVRIDGVQYVYQDVYWYVIGYDSDAKTVTLFSKESFGYAQFNSSGSGNAYADSTIRAYVEGGMLDYGLSLDEIKHALVSVNLTDTGVSGQVPYLLSTDEANVLPQAKRNIDEGWWLRTPGGAGAARYVDGYGNINDTYGNPNETGVGTRMRVRPALQLNLDSVIFNSDSNSFHIHNFNYSASGATITAACSVERCPLTDSKATLTIVPPTLTTYGGAGDAAATLDGRNDFNTATGQTVDANQIKYVGRDGTTYAESADAPTNAGKYTATITVEEKTASVDYEIAKAEPTANAPIGLTATYGQTLADVSLEDKNPSGNTEGSWAWADGSVSVGSVGEQTFKANFTSSNSNYKDKSNVDVTVTVNKAANPATVSDAATVKRGGNTVDLADNVTLNGATGAVTYAFDGEQNEQSGCSLSGSVLRSGNTTGSVTVNVTVAADDNYEALAATPITVTITNKDTQTITAPDVSVTYGETGKSVSAETDGGGQINYAVKDGSADYIGVDDEGVLTVKKVPADGTAYVTVTAMETQTYEQATKDVTVNVSKAELTVKAKDRSIYVGDAVPDLSNPTLDTDYTLDELLGEDELTTSPTLSYQKNGEAAEPDNTQAGTYDIVPFGADAGNNYAISYESGTLTISEKFAQTITASDVTATYGEMGKVVSAEADGGGQISYAVKEGGDVIAVDEVTGALTIKKVGTAIVTVTAAETATFAQATKDVAVTVKKANSKVTKAPVATNPTYDGKAQALVTAGAAEGGTLRYSLDGKSYSDVVPIGTDAKAYDVWYKVIGDANHNDSEAQKVTSTIAKKDEPTPTPAPAKPAKSGKPSTTAYPSKKRIVASWKAVKNATSYELSWRVAGGKWKTRTVKATSYTIPSLKAGKPYDVRVRAANDAGEGAWSSVARCWLKGASKVKAAIGKSKGSVKVTWKKDKSANKGYKVFVYAKKGGKAVKTKTVSKSKASATIKGLKSGRTYYVRVCPYLTKGGATYAGALSSYGATKAK